MYQQEKNRLTMKIRNLNSILRWLYRVRHSAYLAMQQRGVTTFYCHCRTRYIIFSYIYKKNYKFIKNVGGIVIIGNQIELLKFATKQLFNRKSRNLMEKTLDFSVKIESSAEFLKQTTVFKVCFPSLARQEFQDRHT